VASGALLCSRPGQRSAERLYYRFKADETSTYIRGPYERAHPEDNNEAQAVHEHEG
jgi:hypothetical protein